MIAAAGSAADSPPPDQESLMPLLSELQSRAQQARTSSPLPAVAIESDGDDYGDAESVRWVVGAEGTFRRETRQGQETHLIAGDAVECWEQDRLGLVKTLQFSDRDIPRHLAALRAGLWTASVDPTTLAILPDRSDDRQVVFEVTSVRFPTFVTVDLVSGQPVKWEFTGTQGPVTFEFGEYAEHGGRQLPMTVRTTDSLSTRTTRVLSVETLTEPVPGPRPQSVVKQLVFDPTVASEIDVRRAATGHVLTSVVINGHTRRSFIFDTGAGGTVIDSTLARQLKMPVIGRQKLGTVSGTTITDLVVADELQLGPARMQSPTIVTMDLRGFAQAMGDETIAGIIGYDVLSRCVCEIELAHDRIRLFDAATERSSPAWKPLTFFQNIPLTEASFPGGNGLFRIDVGAANGPAGNVIFHAPLVQRTKLLDSATVTSRTTADEVPIIVGSLEWFELHGHRFERPQVIFSEAKSGPLADPMIDGNLGVDFLRPFRIVLDYQRGRLAFERPDPAR